MINNNYYQIINKSHKKLITSTIIIIITFSLVLFLTHTIKYQSFYNNIGTISKNNNNNLNIEIPLSNINTIINHNEIIIDKNIYKYKIKNISEIKYKDNLLNYQNITLEIYNLKEEYKINNLVINYKILEKEIILIKLIKIIMEE